MTESHINQYTPTSVSPPGETLQELLEERGMSQAELAERTGRPKKTINEIVQGKAALTPETALQLERVLRVPTSFWNARERNYRETLARQREAEALGTYGSWVRQFPYRAIVNRGWIKDVRGVSEQASVLLSFFGVASPESWQDLWTSETSFHRSKAFQANRFALAAWLRQGELEAQSIQCSGFDAVRFRKLLHSVRVVTRELKHGFQRELQHRFCEAGVALVFVPELPKTRVWGATQWLTSTKAMIQLSLRYKTDDHFWFTLFHEAGHLLLHGKREVFIEAEDGESQKEEEANQFARDFLIPPRQYKSFIRRPARSCTAIRRFAYELRISPGIVVGRLQHDGAIRRDECNDLKATVDWGDL